MNGFKFVGLLAALVVSLFFSRAAEAWPVRSRIVQRQVIRQQVVRQRVVVQQQLVRQAVVAPVYAAPIVAPVYAAPQAIVQPYCAPGALQLNSGCSSLFVK